MKTDGPGGGWTSLDLLERFREGDERAADALFARHFERLVALARSRLSARLAARTDPEDVALSAYRVFFEGVREGRFVLGRGGDLWRLLAAIARRKLLKQARRDRAARRSVDVETSLDPDADEKALIRRGEPTPEEAAALADELEWALSRLDALGRRALELRLQGRKIEEIAHETGRSERTVRRSLARARQLLAGRLGDD